MRKYRRKPGEVFAARNTSGKPITIKTLHGNATCMPGDWIVQDPKGDKWPVEADIFADTYELVDE